MVINGAALLGGSRPENSGMRWNLYTEKCGKEGTWGPGDLGHFKSPSPGALQAHIVPLAYVAELVSHLTRECLKRLPGDTEVDLFLFTFGGMCVHICVPVHMCVWGQRSTSSTVLQEMSTLILKAASLSAPELATSARLAGSCLCLQSNWDNWDYKCVPPHLAVSGDQT